MYDVVALRATGGEFIRITKPLCPIQSLSSLVCYPVKMVAVIAKQLLRRDSVWLKSGAYTNPLSRGTLYWESQLHFIDNLVKPTGVRWPNDQVWDRIQIWAAVKGIFKIRPVSADMIKWAELHCKSRILNLDSYIWGMVTCLAKTPLKSTTPGNDAL